MDITTPSGIQLISNDDVIICAGGVLPKDILESVGNEFSTKHGESSRCENSDDIDPHYRCGLISFSIKSDFLAV